MFYFIRKSFVVVSLLLSVLTSQTASAKQIISYVFDWDDNIVFMPTTIVLFPKSATKEDILSGKAKEIDISTGEFALERTHIGKEGKYAYYQIWNGDDESQAQYGSYKHFRVGVNGENYFLSDLRSLNLFSILNSKQEQKIIAPSFEKMIFALQYPEIAEWTYVLTARGQPQEQLHEGVLELIKIMNLTGEHGFTKFYAPPVQNLIGVSHPKFRATMTNPSEAKLTLMMQILDKIQSNDFESLDPYVVNQDGTAREQLHLFGFSDDDHKTFDLVQKRLSEEVAKGRWTKIKIRLFFTGEHHTLPQKKVVLMRDGTTRTTIAQEDDEAFRTMVQRCDNLLKRSNK